MHLSKSLYVSEHCWLLNQPGSEIKLLIKLLTPYYSYSYTLLVIHSISCVDSGSGSWAYPIYPIPLYTRQAISPGDSFQFALYSQTFVSRSLFFCVVRIEEGRVMRAIVDTILQLFASREVLVPLFFGKKKRTIKTPISGPDNLVIFAQPPSSSCALLDSC